MPHRPSEMNVDTLIQVLESEFGQRGVPRPPAEVIQALADTGRAWLIAVTGNRDIPVTGQYTGLGARIVTAWIDGSHLPAEPAWKLLGVLVAKIKEGAGIGAALQGDVPQLANDQVQGL